MLALIAATSITCHGGRSMVHGSRPVVWALRFFFMESFHLAGTDARLAEKRGSITPSFQGTYTPYLLPVRLAHRILTLPILARCSSFGKPSLETAFSCPENVILMDSSFNCLGNLHSIKNLWNFPLCENWLRW